MKVLYILSQNKGGLPHYAAELSNAVSQNAEVTVIKSSVTTADDVFSDRVNVVELFEDIHISLPDMYNLDFDLLGSLRGLLSYRNLEYIHDFDPDVIHDPTGFFPQVKFFSKYYQIDEEYPFVVTYHEVPPSVLSLSNPFETVGELLNIAIPDIHTNQIIVHSDQQRSAFVNRLDRSENITVIPHGSYEFFKSYDYQRQSEEPTTILFFGNIFPGKGLDTLAEAVSIVAEDLPEIRLIIAGDGPLSSETTQIIAAADEGRFEVHNTFIPNERVGEFFSRAALVVLPYRDIQGNGTKGHSGVLATAHAFGKSVVATRTGDFPSQVEKTGSGLVVPPEDPVALAEAIVSLLTDTDRRSKMEVNSRHQAERLSWTNIAKRHLEIYRDAVSSHHTKGNLVSARK